jgi:hypothetical protein
MKLAEDKGIKDEGIQYSSATGEFIHTDYKKMLAKIPE